MREPSEFGNFLMYVLLSNTFKVTYPETNSDSTMQMIEQCMRLENGEGPDVDA